MPVWLDMCLHNAGLEQVAEWDRDHIDQPPTALVGFYPCVHSCDVTWGAQPAFLGSSRSLGMSLLNLQRILMGWSLYVLILAGNNPPCSRLVPSTVNQGALFNNAFALVNIGYLLTKGSTFDQCTAPASQVSRSE